MGYVLPEIILPLIATFLVGLGLGWLLWRWRSEKVTWSEWETSEQTVSKGTGAATTRSAFADGAVAPRDTAATREATIGRDAAVASKSGASPSGAGAGPGVGAGIGTPTGVGTLVGGAGISPYGDGSHAPLPDRSAPDGYTIKGNVDSMLYHRPDSRNYGATVAEVWFDSADRAEASGFRLSPTHPKAGATATSEVTAPVAFVGEIREPYGDGSHAPLADRSAPDGYTIKGNVDSMLYHRPDSRNYGATVAEVWFDSADRAEASGFSKSPTHPKGT